MMSFSGVNQLLLYSDYLTDWRKMSSKRVVLMMSWTDFSVIYNSDVVVDDVSCCWDIGIRIQMLQQLQITWLPCGNQIWRHN